MTVGGRDRVRRIAWPRVILAALLGGAGALVAVLAAGGGHGTYLPAKLLFPYSMLSTLWTDGSISVEAMCGALVQMPAYTIAFDLFGRSRRALMWLVLMHLMFFLASIATLRLFPEAPPR